MESPLFLIGQGPRCRPERQSLDEECGLGARLWSIRKGGSSRERRGFSSPNSPGEREEEETPPPPRLECARSALKSEPKCAEPVGLVKGKSGSGARALIRKKWSCSCPRLSKQGQAGMSPATNPAHTNPPWHLASQAGRQPSHERLRHPPSAGSSV